MKSFLTWFPRILIIGFAVFISFFALDAFSEGGSIVRRFIGFLIHLIPTALTLIILWVSWQNRVLGGLLFIIWGLVFTIYYDMTRSISLFLMFSLPLLLAGFLFLISQVYFEKKLE